MPLFHVPELDSRFLEYLKRYGVVRGGYPEPDWFAPGADGRAYMGVLDG